MSVMVEHSSRVMSLDVRGFAMKNRSDRQKKKETYLPFHLLLDLTMNGFLELRRRCLNLIFIPFGS